MRRFSALAACLFIIVGLHAQTTWSQHIAPILYANCTNCHHTNGIAPFSLMTYADAYNNAASIKNDVTNRVMPPWSADPNYKHYVHERVLSAADIAAIQDWASNGAVQGSPTLAPPQPTYVLGSQLGTVDLSISIPNYTVSGSGDVYRDFVIPCGQSISKYITAIEIVPGNAAIVHHVVLFQDSTNVPAQLDAADPGPGYTDAGGTGSNASSFITAWAPGGQPYYTPVGLGFKLVANTNFVVQVHYPDGTQGQVDSTRINFKLSTAVLRDITALPILNHLQNMTNGPLSIPANQVKSFHEQYNLPPINISVLNAFPHMHLVGKSIKSWANAPTTHDTVRFVDVPDWEFHWQSNYVFPNVVKVLGGSTLHATATYDNTTNNPDNPNSPPQLVQAGEQTTDEMMVVFFAFLPYQTGDENIIVDRRVIPMGATTFCNGQSVRLNTIEGTGYHYQWYRGTTLLTNDTSANYYATQSGNYYVKITLGPNNAWSDTIPVTVSSAPTATITAAGSTAICSGQSATLNASTGSGYTYQWFMNNSPINNATSATYNATTAGSYTVQVYNGCYAASSAQTITTGTTPTANITPSGATTFCSGSNVTLTGGGGTSYHWSSSQTTPAISATSTGTYTVTVTDANGCTAATSKTVTVNPNPNATISATGATTFCQGGSVTLTAANGTLYHWSNSQNSADILISTGGTYTVTVTDANSCSATATQTVTVNPLPSSIISEGSSTTFCDGGSVTLSAPAGNSYHWSNNGAAASINVTTSGTYTVTVTSNQNCSATSSPTTVTVNPLPTASATFSIASNTVTFTNGSQNGTSYSWDFGDATSPSNDVNPVHTYSAVNSYTVVLTTTNGCGIKTDTILVNLNCTPFNFTIAHATNPTFCAGQSVVLNTTTSATTYQWLLNGQPISNATANNYTASQSGIYSLQAIDGSGCPGTSDTIRVTAKPLPATTIAITGATSFCPGDSVFIQASVSRADYQWYVDGNAISGATFSNLNIKNSGAYHVQMILEGCQNTTSDVSVTVFPVTTPTVTKSSHVLTVTTSDAFDWYNDNGLIAGATTPTYTATENSCYYVKSTSVNNCTAKSDTVCITDFITGIPAINSSNAVNIYPNPGTDELNISLQYPAPVEVRITDLSGKVIYTSLTENGTLHIDVKTLPAALYLVKVKGENISVVKHWLKVQ